MLITTHNQRIVNLKNVSTVFADSTNLRVIFNFSNNIKVSDKFSSDYLYWNFSTYEELTEAMYNLRFIILGEFFTSHMTNHKMVNPESVNNIKFSDEELRVIFNMNYSTSNDKLNGKIVAESVYWEFKDINAYEKAKQEIQNKTNNINEVQNVG